MPLAEKIRDHSMRSLIRYNNRAAYWGVYVRYGFLGALLLVLVVHPALEVLHQLSADTPLRFSWEVFVFQPILGALDDSAWPVTLAVGLGGVLIGGTFGALHLRAVRKPFENVPRPETTADLEKCVSAGEGEQVEFKSSLRWDRNLGKVNKALELVIAKTLCGMMNHDGGLLLVGVEDDGSIAGIEDDFKTLKHENWDGFQQRIIALAASNLGGQYVGLLRSHCVLVKDKTVAIIQVAPAPTPVFCKDGNAQRYYLRAGNTTRELDSREALEHAFEKRKNV